MTAIVYADLKDAELIWTRRAAVFEYLLEDLATRADADLKSKIHDAIESEGWNIGDLSTVNLEELAMCARYVLDQYRERQHSAGARDPDYSYLGDSLDELLKVVLRILESRALQASSDL